MRNLRDKFIRLLYTDSKMTLCLLSINNASDIL